MDAVGRECRVARIVTVRAIFIRHKHKNDRFRRYYAAGPTRHATSVFAARLGVSCVARCVGPANGNPISMAEHRDCCAHQHHAYASTVYWITSSRRASQGNRSIAIAPTYPTRPPCFRERFVYNWMAKGCMQFVHLIDASVSVSFTTGWRKAACSSYT